MANILEALAATAIIKSIEIICTTLKIDREYRICKVGNLRKFDGVCDDKCMFSIDVISLRGHDDVQKKKMKKQPHKNEYENNAATSATGAAHRNN